MRKKKILAVLLAMVMAFVAMPMGMRVNAHTGDLAYTHASCHDSECAMPYESLILEEALEMFADYPAIIEMLMSLSEQANEYETTLRSDLHDCSIFGDIRWEALGDEIVGTATVCFIIRSVETAFCWWCNAILWRRLWHSPVSSHNMVPIAIDRERCTTCSWVRVFPVWLREYENLS